MQESEARKTIEVGYYSSTHALETDEIWGLISTYFPNVDTDRELEEIVADIISGRA